MLQATLRRNRESTTACGWAQDPQRPTETQRRQGHQNQTTKFRGGMEVVDTPKSGVVAEKQDEDAADQREIEDGATELRTWP